MSAMHICHDKGLFEGKYPRNGNIQMSLKEIQFQEIHVVECCYIKLHRKNTISDGSSGKKIVFDGNVVKINMPLEIISAKPNDYIFPATFALRSDVSYPRKYYYPNSNLPLKMRDTHRKYNSFFHH